MLRTLIKWDVQHPYAVLDEPIRTSLTPTNLNSAIIQINATQGKFLFAADAWLDSFLNIPDYQNKLRDVHFLKVPHHGSANNLNAEIIQLTNPKIAFISGGSHVSPLVVNALHSNGTAVYSTSDAATTLTYPISDTL